MSRLTENSPTLSRLNSAGRSSRSKVLSRGARLEGRCSKVEPILRWAGSKRKLVPHLLALFPRQYRRYIEPFAGSACAFAALSPKKAILSDINAELIRTYRALANSPTKVARALHSFDLRKRTYYDLRALDPGELGVVMRAARFIYLNRRCFNGVYRLNRDGAFNVPLGRRTGPLPSPEHLISFAKLLRAAELRAGDFEATVARAGQGDLLYLDPPYTKPGTRFRGEYGWNAFRENDEKRLVTAIRKAAARGATVVISYRGSIGRKLRGWRRRHMFVLRSVSGFARTRRRVTEVIFSSPHRPGKTPRGALNKTSSTESRKTR